MSGIKIRPDVTAAERRSGLILFSGVTTLCFVTTLICTWYAVLCAKQLDDDALTATFVALTAFLAYLTNIGTLMFGAVRRYQPEQVAAPSDET